jgi:hypothetical protein
MVSKHGGVDTVASLMEALELEGVTLTEYSDPNQVNCMHPCADMHVASSELVVHQARIIT